MKHFSSPIWTRIRAFVSASSRACNRMRRSAAYGKANHLGSIVFNKLPPKQMMKVASTKFAKLIQLCVMAILAFTPFSVVDTVIAYPESIPHFPGDRWDPEWTERDVWGPDIMEPGQLQRMTRHWTFMNEGVPPEYRGKANPLASTRSVIQAGSMLYQQQCSACHGAEGMGDGKAANSVNPSPALLAYMIQRPQSVDEYLMWSIAEGGKAFGTPMPAFKSTLSDLQIWKIIIFMRAGFPPLKGK